MVSDFESEAESIMETDFDPHLQVLVSNLEHSLRICCESLDIKKDLSFVLLEKNQSQSTIVIVHNIAHQLFDAMFLSVRRGKQLNKQSKFSKTWKFRFKNKNV